MSKRKTYEIFLSTEDRIDVDLEFRKSAGTPPHLERFAISYSARIRGRWREVVRYDNFHGGVHRQRFWRTGSPERVPAWERFPFDALLEACRRDLRENWRRYRTLMEDREESP
jgi:hypothetical protein